MEEINVLKKVNDIEILIKFIVSPNELEPVPIIKLSKFLLCGIEFINLISLNINNVLNDMNWDISKQKTKIAAMWAIINIGGASNSRHHHGNSDISAAYYVRAPKNCGEIVFYDPRPAPVYFHPLSTKPNSLNAMQNSVNPVEGGLVLFPSYLDHSVNPNISNEERIGRH